VKQGLALVQAGHSVVFLQNRIANPDAMNVLPIVSFYGPLSQFKAKLDVFTNIDLIHVHNEPSSLVKITKEARPEVPVVFDVHDLNAVRYHRVEEAEVEAFAACDAVVWPSKGYQRFCTEDFQYQFPGLKDKPQEVIYSMCTENILEIPPAARVRGIVYQGRVSTDEDEKDYREIVLAMDREGIPFYVYPSNMANVTQYSNAGAIVMPTAPFAGMMHGLSRFDWGFCGPAMRSRQGDNGMANKLFEYITAGIPIIVHEASEMAEFVTRHELGVVIEHYSDIPKIYDKHAHFRKIVASKQKEFTMETQLEKLEGLYRRVLRDERPIPPAAGPAADEGMKG